MNARAGIGDLRKSLRGSGFVHADDAAPEQRELSFAGDARSFGDRLRNALRRRLAPNTTLHLKQLAAAIGVTDRAMQKILAGDSDGQGGTVAAIIEFFVTQGDAGLMHELFSIPPLVFLREHRNAMTRVRRQIKELKRWLDAGEREVA